MADNEESTAAIPPNSETNAVVETTEIMETLPVSDIQQGNNNSGMDIVSMALSNVTETANLMVDSNVVTAVEEVENVEVQGVQQFEQVEVIEQQVVHEIPISNDMVITSADGHIILPSNSTAAELSAVETLVGGALQQNILVQQTDDAEQQVVTESVIQDVVVSSVPMTYTTETSVPVVETSDTNVLTLGGGVGAQNISASSLLGSIATMIDSSENGASLVGMKINSTGTMAQASGNLLTRSTPAANVSFATSINTPVQPVVSNSIAPTITIPNNVDINTTTSTPAPSVVPTSTTAMGLNSVITAPKQTTSLPSTITIKTPPGSNSVSQSLLNSILNNSDVQALLRRNPGQPITIVRVPEDSPGGKNVNKITVTTGKLPSANSTIIQNPISTPVSKPSTAGIKLSNASNSNKQVGRPRGRPPGKPRSSLSREPTSQPILVKSKKTRSGRLSRPPLHHVRDYKTIHIQEMGDTNDDKEEFVDYDGDLVSQSQVDFTNYGVRPKSFKCDKCDRAYIGKGGLARHFKNNPSHGDPADLGVTYDDEEDQDAGATGSISEQQQITPVHTPMKRKKRGRPPLRTNGDPDFHPNRHIPKKAGGKITIDLATQNLNRKKQRIQELIKTIGDEDLMELALPRLSKAITVWEFLLMKVEEAHSQQLPFREILKQFESVRKHVRLFADECLERVASKQETTPNASKDGEDNNMQTEQSADDVTDKQNGNESEMCDSSKSALVIEETSHAGGDNESQTSTLVSSEKEDASLEQTNSKSNDSADLKTSDESKSKDNAASLDKTTNKSNDSTNLKTSDDESTSKTKENASLEQTNKKSDDLIADLKTNDESKSESEQNVTLEQTDNKSKDSSDLKTIDEPNSDTGWPISKNESNESETEITKDDLEPENEISKTKSNESKSQTEVSKNESEDSKSSSVVQSEDESRTQNKELNSLKDTERTVNNENESLAKDGESLEHSPITEMQSNESKYPETAAFPTEPGNDFLELDSEIAKALGMETGRYSVKEWMTTKLPAMFKFSKAATDDQDGSISEEEILETGVDDDASETPAKKQKIDNEEIQQQKQVPKIQLPSENNTPEKPQVPHPVALTTSQPLSQQATSSQSLLQQSTTTENKGQAISTALPPLTPMPSDGSSEMTTADAQSVIRQAAEVTQVQQEEEQAMVVDEPSYKVVEDDPKATEEAAAYQTEEQGSQQAIVPEGSTIMQMEDGTFLVQKPDGTAMQIHCPEGMTIETIQALLSMDAGNILQSAE